METTISKLVQFREQKLQEKAKEDLKERSQDLATNISNIEGKLALMLNNLRKHYPDLAYGTDNSEVLVLDHCTGKVVGNSYRPELIEQYQELRVEGNFSVQITEYVFLEISNIAKANLDSNLIFSGICRDGKVMFTCPLRIGFYSENFYLRLIGHLEEAHEFVEHRVEIELAKNQLQAEAALNKLHLQQRIAAFRARIESHNDELLKRFEYDYKSLVEFPYTLWECTWQRGFGFIEGETYFDYQTELTKSDRLIDGEIINLQGFAIRPGAYAQFVQKTFSQLSELPQYCQQEFPISQIKTASLVKFPVLKDKTSTSQCHKNPLYFSEWYLDYQCSDISILYQEEEDVLNLIQEFDDILTDDCYLIPSEERCFTITVPNPDLLL